jgi:hypothetical protein
VIVPAGEHEVRFVYDRSRFETGRKISIAALLLSLGLAIGGVVAGFVASGTSKKNPQKSP